VLGAIGRHDLTDAGALLTSEVVTNAVLHGAPPLRVSVEPGEGRVRVVVTDGGGGRPELGEADPSALHGRGIHLVDSVAERWGVEELPEGTGKSVWFDLH
jgi:anti-sigma regulatory factor (Ser/Thr protein kinase)